MVVNVTGRQLETMRKCVVRVEEIGALLCEHGIHLHEVVDITVLSDEFGSATLRVDLDFRKKEEL